MTAFEDRGQSDFLASHDLEDVLTIVDGRKSLYTELAAEREDLRQYVAGSIKKLLNTPSFLDALPGHMLSDDASQARLPLLIERLGQITTLE
ncbi:MAG TPA: hypothetical protein DCZ95_00670 [Verrucomicrobia bacterium]|nr:hypothetical protein [Verrucomicrobiota bacterium]